MQVVVNEVNKPVPEGINFKRGDKFPVLVKCNCNGKEQRRIFFTECVSIIVDGSAVGAYVPDTCSVYHPQYIVCHDESVTLTLTQD